MITTSTPPTGWQQAAAESDLHQRLCRLAYDLYEQRGKEDGWDLDDWLHAESELTQKNRKTARYVE